MPTSRHLKLLSEALGYPVDLQPKRLNRRERLERDIEKLQKRQLERIKRGRTRGAGAGGFNRDVDNIVHQIRLLQIELAELVDQPLTPGEKNEMVEA